MKRAQIKTYKNNKSCYGVKKQKKIKKIQKQASSTNLFANQPEKEV